MKKIFVLLFVFGLVVPSLYAKTFNFKIVEDLIYDDNIYYSDKNTEGSFLSSTKLYANFLSKIPSTSINVDANAHVGYNAYTEDFYNNSYMDAGLDLKLNNRFFDFRESFTYTSDPANNSFNERAERINNDVYLGYTSNKEKKLGFGVYAQDILDDYLKERYEYLNRNRVNLGAKLFYNFNPKKSVYLGYQYSNIDYSKNTFNNSNGNSYFLGATGEITAKIKGTAQVSYDDRHYNKKYEDSLENGNLIGSWQMLHTNLSILQQYLYWDKEKWKKLSLQTTDIIYLQMLIWHLNNSCLENGHSVWLSDMKIWNIL
jgi:hypothetical protein